MELVNMMSDNVGLIAFILSLVCDVDAIKLLEVPNMDKFSLEMLITSITFDIQSSFIYLMVRFRLHHLQNNVLIAAKI